MHLILKFPIIYLRMIPVLFLEGLLKGYPTESKTIERWNLEEAELARGS